MNTAIRFFDQSLNFLGEIQNYISLRYTCKWSTYGAFTVVLSGVPPLAKMDNILMLGKDQRKNGIIKYVQYNQASDETTIKGHSLLWLLSNRITVPPDLAYHTVAGTVGEIMAAYVRTNAATPTEPARKIPQLEIGNISGVGGTTRYQTRYKVLLDEITTLSKASNIGVGVELDYHQKKLVFMAYEGLDRSVNQTVRSPYILNPAHYNVTNVVVTENDIGTKNCAYVGGKGEGAERSIHIVNPELTGFARRELFVDARDMESALDLRERGLQKLADTVKADSYEYDTVMGDYGIRWDLGDFVTLHDKNFGITRTDQITEVEIAIENTGTTITPTFGIPEKTLAEVLTPTGGIVE
ncbi:siphovirus ReqiPepy6 Gp37-like family protein [Hominifimenecus sp. rT4P-3]|uniref:siphovirus ReqiPepy6 Gp37-like family protein n=1 Tax=Hominifimenecus sp. rT4P-3 TaxID=3242979 RepID=UPI003DA57D22